MADAVLQSAKIKMEQYPLCARPSLTRKFMEEFNAIAVRQGSWKDLQKAKLIHR